MVRQTPWVVFAASVFLLWVALVSVMNFLSVTLQGMGAPEGLIGLSWTTAAVAEIPVMLASAWLLRRIGPARLVAVGILGYAVRLTFFALMPSPYWAPAINALNGISYAPFWIGAVAYVSELAPESLKTTAQGMLASVMSLASIMGALLGGWLFDILGPTGMFGVMAGLCAAAFALFSVGQRAIRSR